MRKSAHRQTWKRERKKHGVEETNAIINETTYTISEISKHETDREAKHSIRADKVDLNGRTPDPVGFICRVRSIIARVCSSVQSTADRSVKVS